MANIWGKKIRLSIFGESHGSAIGVIIDGLPAGEDIDVEFIESEMRRRAPGRDDFATSRHETDNVIIQSGIFGGKTTGFPVCGMIFNENARSGDYNLSMLRPGHADLTAYYKYRGFADMRGGGHFSGRLTAPLVFAGAIAKQILSRRGITIGAHIAAIGASRDVPISPLTKEHIDEITAKPFPVCSESAEADMRKIIATAKQNGDSVGGIIEAMAIGAPAGVGDPFFDSFESRLSSLLFSIPAVKGVEFGDGFGFACAFGSEANDAYRIKDGEIEITSNHNGGILGGITNGMPIIVRVAIKPTPSIEKTQNTVDIAKMENAEISIKGRHDPCIVPRAVAVVEAAIAICLLDGMES